VFPAVAVAEAAQGLADVDVVFVGTERGLEARVVPSRGWRLEGLSIEPIKGGGPLRAIRSAAVAALATVRAARIVRRLRPRAVLSVGGYAAGPAALAAALLGVPVAVFEANSTVGLANRVLAPFARLAFVAWEEAAGAFRKGTVRRHGVPLRAGFEPSPRGTAHESSRLLVMGGSQGAAVLNERLPEALGRLAREGRAFEVVHQAGRDRDALVREAYAREKVERAVVVPFIDDVARAIAEADVIVARAGAGTLAEIAAVGRPAVLVPFPHAADDHQARNAESLARAGAAVCVRQDQADPARLALEIGRLLGDGEARRLMAAAARGRGRPHAARAVARDLLAMAAIPEREPRAPLNGKQNGTHGGDATAARRWS
jgi:UDP-N-acetylglucosamine--N-acetylmuramyl-(pentapeptide) pyrophosphoryl-undecaprenol N-acetylglucosamine transferase